jgi:hypothetical protein
MDLYKLNAKNKNTNLYSIIYIYPVYLQTKKKDLKMISE